MRSVEHRIYDIMGSSKFSQNRLQTVMTTREKYNFLAKYVIRFFTLWTYENDMVNCHPNVIDFH